MLGLGIEGGGTKTVALLSDGRRRSFGPLNLRLATDRQVLDVLRQFQPYYAAICLSGCRTEADRQRLRQLARRAWPKLESVFIGNDLDSGLAAAFGRAGAGILVISGTGSVVIGRDERGRLVRAGGWGHLLGDHGSGYWIAITGLRAAIRDYDRHGRVNAGVLCRLCLNSMDELVDWIQQASKSEIAGLASEFIEPGLMLQAASFLAQDCHAVACKLGMEKPHVVLAGGLIKNHRKLAILVSNRIRTMLPGAQVSILRRDTAAGALLLASQFVNLSDPKELGRLTRKRGILRFAQRDELALTERRNPRTVDLHRRSVSQLVGTMLREESRVIPAILASKRALVRCISTVVATFKRGGRLFYVGAGTSGRLGVLDASECPPTFSTNPEMVQAIIAGGARALQSAVEAAEDDPLAGAEALRNRGVNQRDVVVGIAASGSTPFVLGALDEAQRRGAKTFILSCSPVTSRHTPIVIATGPEVLTGSTRLKAGTATKLALNMLTTISMIRLGKVVSNLMVDVKPTNEKLRARACRIVATLRNCSEEQARRRLVRARWNVKRALR